MYEKALRVDHAAEKMMLFIDLIDIEIEWIVAIYLFDGQYWKKDRRNHNKERMDICHSRMSFNSILYHLEFSTFELHHPPFQSMPNRIIE